MDHRGSKSDICFKYAKLNFVKFYLPSHLLLNRITMLLIKRNNISRYLDFVLSDCLIFHLTIK